MLSGLPRSGTTWTAKVIGHAPDTFYMHEPDNETFYLKALILKDELNRFPYLKTGHDAPLYHKLWKDIFNRHTYSDVFPDKNKISPWKMEKILGEKSEEIHKKFFRYSDDSQMDDVQMKDVDIPAVPDKERLFIKSVHNLFALDWLDYHFDFQPVIVIRNPANTISSYLKMQFQDSWRNVFHQEDLVKDYFKDILPKLNRKNDVIEKMTIQIAAAYYVLQEQLASHPDWILLRHEDLCLNPIKEFKHLYKKLDLKWTREVKDFINESNQPGKGYKTNRVAEEEIDKYKTLLTKKQISQINKVYELFGNPFYKEI